eukprot:403346379
MYKSLPGQPIQDSVYLRFRITDFNLTKFEYQVLNESSGIFLIESIQNLKYYIQNLGIQAKFNTHFDFSGLLTQDQTGQFDSEIKDSVYGTEFNLENFSFSVSSKLNVSEKGDLNLYIPSLSLSLQPQNIGLKFDKTDECDFIKSLSGTIENVKNVLLEDSSNLAIENKDLIEKVHQIIGRMLSEFRYKGDNFIIQTKFAQPKTSIATNPIIMSNFISGVLDVNATAIQDKQSHEYVTDDDSYDDAYLPIYDPNGSDMQLIASEKLLNKFAYLIYNVSGYGEQSPFIVDQDYIFFEDEKQKTIKQLPCVTDLLESMFPGITQTYGSQVKCRFQTRVVYLGGFNINTGRFFTANNMTIEILITLYTNKTSSGEPDYIRMRSDLELVYLNMQLTKNILQFQIYDTQPKDFRLISPLTPKFTFNSDAMIADWNANQKAITLKYYNQKGQTEVPDAFFEWIPTNLKNSLSNFKVDLYDKYLIVNIVPNYGSEGNYFNYC